MKLSFVIPARNEEASIGKTIESILAATKGRTDTEIIVSDNGSTDKTKEVVGRYPGVKLVEEPIPGTSRTRERGFRASTGEFVGFLDSDVLLPDGWIARVEKEFSRNKNLVCLSGPYVYYDLPSGINFLVKVFYGLSYVAYFVARFIFRTGAVVMGGNYVVRRTALEAIGGHDVTITFYGDDTDVARRMSKVGEVKFSFSFPVFSSGRRFATEGLMRTAVRYSLNYFWVIIFRRPFTMSSKAVRKEGSGKTLAVQTYDWILGFFVLLLLLAIAVGILYGVYYIASIVIHAL